MCSTCEATYTVDGMTCGGCAGKVEKAIRTLDSVSDVTVDVERREVRVVGDASQDDVARVVAEAGYSLS